jgi:hypothetical protein
MDSGKRIFDSDSKLFLTGIKILRPDSLALRALRGWHNHPVKKMEAVSSMGFHPPP